LPEGPEVSPDVLACHALLNCLIREVSAPEDQAWEDDGHLVIRLARSAIVLRAKLRRPYAGSGPRPAGEVQVLEGAAWHEIGWRRLAELIAAELTLATGTPNTEFATQVSDAHAAFGAILRERAGQRKRSEEIEKSEIRGTDTGMGPDAGLGRGTGAETGGRPGGGVGREGADRVEAYLASE